MNNQLATIFTGTYRIISPLHHYNNDATEDVVIIITAPYDGINYIAINNINNTVISRVSLPCMDKLKDTILENDSSITRNDLSITSVFGIYNSSISVNIKIATVFFVLVNMHTLENYLVQVDVTNHDPNNLIITPITKFFNSNNVYFDTTVTTNVTVNDYTNVSEIDAYITFVDAGPTNTLSSASIEGIRILVSDAEKQLFAVGNNIVLPDTIYPLVDIWSNQHRQFFQLTEDTEKIKLNFSTGLGFIGFKNQ